jgi:hypothetical protein
MEKNEYKTINEIELIDSSENGKIIKAEWIT